MIADAIERDGADAADAADAGAARRFGCPLADCAFAARSGDDLYCHLLVTHRKSDLGAALVDRDGDRSAGGD